MHAKSLALLAGVAGAFLVAQQPASAGPTTCPTTGAVCIDESIEGATPTITIPSTLVGLVTTSVVPVGVAVGEAWAVAFGFPNGSSLRVSFTSTALLEPGSQSLSDAINSVSINSPSTGPVVLTYGLFSDNDLGQIGTTCSFCQSTLTEDGTFQQLTGNSITAVGTTLNLYLKSDLDVPEPTSLVLFGTALVGFGLIRRRRRSV